MPDENTKKELRFSTEITTKELETFFKEHYLNRSLPKSQFLYHIMQSLPKMDIKTCQIFYNSRFELELIKVTYRKYPFLIALNPNKITLKSSQSSPSFPPQRTYDRILNATLSYNFLNNKKPINNKQNEKYIPKYFQNELCIFSFNDVLSYDDDAISYIFHDSQMEYLSNSINRESHQRIFFIDFLSFSGRLMHHISNSAVGESDEYKKYLRNTNKKIRDYIQNFYGEQISEKGLVLFSMTSEDNFYKLLGNKLTDPKRSTDLSIYESIMSTLKLLDSFSFSKNVLVEINQKLGTGNERIVYINDHSVHYPTQPPELINELLDGVISSFNQKMSNETNLTLESRILSIVEFIQSLENIHPFEDAQSETCQLIMQALLIHYDIHPSVFFDRDQILSLNTEQLVKKIIGSNITQQPSTGVRQLPLEIRIPGIKVEKTETPLISSDNSIIDDELTNESSSILKYTFFNKNDDIHSATTATSLSALI